MSDTKTDTTEGKRMESDVNLDDILGAEIKLTGADLPPGSYPATLFGFGAPFRMKVTEQFKKEGGPEYKDNFDLRFGVVDKQGNLVEQTYMVGVPDGGEVNRKSNLFKALLALSNGDPKVINEKGEVAKGLKLKSLIGRNCVLNIEKNKKDFPQVASVAQKLAAEGVKYPSLEECKKLLTSSEGVPF